MRATERWADILPHKVIAPFNSPFAEATAWHVGGEAVPGIRK